MAIIDGQEPPAYAPPELHNDAPIALTIAADQQGKDFLISLAPPKEPIDHSNGAASGLRAPVDFVLVIDVSGSMDAMAPAPGENETNDLTVLDVVKHSVRTIVNSMSDDDRVAVVTFSTSAKVVVPLSRTDKQGKEDVMKKVENLRSDSATNLWDGLKEGMNVLTADSATKDLVPLSEVHKLDDKKDEKTPRPLGAQRLSSIFLLTDGMPNHIPPRGHIPMLKRYLESQPPSKTQFTINTFGFGYSLDSQLLHDIAAIGKGTYGFIPDSGMVGTVFVHATANTYATFAQGGEINIELDDESRVKELEVLGGFETTKSSWGVKIDLGAIQYGQTKDVVVRLPKGLGTASLAATVNYRPWWSSVASPVATVTQVYSGAQNSLPVDPSVSAPVPPNLLHHVHRLTFVQDVLSLFPKSDSSPSLHHGGPGGNKQQAAAKLGEKLNILAQQIKSDFADPAKSDTPPDSDALALSNDIAGEVLLALDYDPNSPQTASKPATNFNKWGRHYLPSLARSHQRQQCSNFKDAGLQVYGRDSPLFVKSRDEMDALFDTLPPPVPSKSSTPVYGSYNTAVPAHPPFQSFGAPGGPPPPVMHQRTKSKRGSMGGGLFGMMLSSSSSSAQPLMQQQQQQQMSSASTNVGRTSMASWNRKAAPCFAGHCLVTANNGSVTRVDQLKRGEVVQTPSGPRTVAAIVRTAIPEGEMEMCVVGEGLLVTPWHPIQTADRGWVFPAQVSQPQTVACKEVFSILLEPDQNSEAHSVWIGGVLCVTLGHGVVQGNDVRAHPFLGNYASILDSLARNAAFYSAEGVLDSLGTVKDAETGLVSGFVWFTLPTAEKGAGVEMGLGKSMVECL